MSFLMIGFEMLTYWSPQRAWRDGRGLVIYAVGLEFESRRASLVRV